MSKGTRLHFIGIGGAGMSSLARFAVEAGYPVSGSELRDAPVLAELEALGCVVHRGHDAQLVANTDIAVFSSAIPATNVELVAANAHGHVRVLHRGELLADIVAEHPHGVAVCGTHGKGTTAGAIVAMVEAANRSVGYVLGAPRRATGRSARAIANAEFLVAEVDESDRTHEHHRPKHLLINNLEADHLNVYGSLGAIVDSFAEFCTHFDARDQRGTCIVGLDGEGMTALVPRLRGQGIEIITCALHREADVQGVNLEQLPDGRTRFDLMVRGERLGTLESGLKGDLNARNLVAAAAMAWSLDLPFAAIAEAARGYQGLVDRFHEMSVAQRLIITDYTSHPTSIAGNLDALHLRASGRVHAVFQPFRYSLLAHHWDAYVDALQRADVLHLAPLDGGGEDPIAGLSSAALAAAVSQAGVRANAHDDLHSIEQALGQLEEGDAAIVFGGGPLFEMARRVASDIQQRNPQC